MGRTKQLIEAVVNKAENIAEAMFPDSKKNIDLLLRYQPIQGKVQIAESKWSLYLNGCPIYDVKDKSALISRLINLWDTDKLPFIFTNNFPIFQPNQPTIKKLLFILRIQFLLFKECEYIDQLTGCNFSNHNRPPDQLTKVNACKPQGPIAAVKALFIYYLHESKTIPRPFKKDFEKLCKNYAFEGSYNTVYDFWRILISSKKQKEVLNLKNIKQVLPLLENFPVALVKASNDYHELLSEVNQLNE